MVHVWCRCLVLVLASCHYQPPSELGVSVEGSLAVMWSVGLASLVLVCGVFVLWELRVGFGLVTI